MFLSLTLHSKQMFYLCSPYFLSSPISISEGAQHKAEKKKVHSGSRIPQVFITLVQYRFRRCVLYRRLVWYVPSVTPPNGTTRGSVIQPRHPHPAARPSFRARCRSGPAGRGPEPCLPDYFPEVLSSIILYRTPGLVSSTPWDNDINFAGN